MDCSTPGFPVLHHLPELAQTHVHQIGDALESSNPLLSPSPPEFISNFTFYTFHSLILFQTCSLTITWWMGKKKFTFVCIYSPLAAAAAAKSLQSCLTLSDPIDGSRLLLLICVKCINFFQKTSRSDMNWIFSCLPSQLRYLMARTLPAFKSLDCNPVSGTELLLINAY